MADEKIKLFVSKGCPPCHEILEKVQQGKFNQEEVEVIDLESEEGFPYIEKLNLSKVPTAMKGDKACRIGIDRDEDVVIIDCEEK